MEEYLTVDELCQKTKYARQSVYNMINRNIFKLNEHFYKPTPKKILFKTSAIESWLTGNGSRSVNKPGMVADKHSIKEKRKAVNKIHI
jgi:predicted DNA-binding transcriptional regulator AlpA